MRVAYYPSFRALDHVRSSGLVSIARDVRAAMLAGGHEVILPMNLPVHGMDLPASQSLAGRSAQALCRRTKRAPTAG